MLIILIPIGWLAILAFFVILCQAAARGDEAMIASARASRTSARAPRSARSLLAGPHLPAARAHSSAPGGATARLTVRRPSVSRLPRSRRPRCVH